jgi:hypothetical protein
MTAPGERPVATPGKEAATGLGHEPVMVLPAAQWRVTEARHQEEVDRLTAGHRQRAGRGIAHPVEDFLFSYYSLRPAQLRRWYPGAGVALLEAPERVRWPFHRATTARHAVTVDVPAFLDARGRRLDFIVRLLRATSAAPGQFGCFGLHEWAMVFEQDADRRRHESWPLRLGRNGTDNVVREHQIRCSHYDAFRFFTPTARPRNLLQPDLDSRVASEQPGCLHAAMDVYKWSYQLLPVVPSELLLDCFRLAKAVREVDMRASPYDLTDLGYPPIMIETAGGKAEYVAAQREFARSAQALRHRLLAVLHAVSDPASRPQAATSPAATSRADQAARAADADVPRRDALTARANRPG